MNSIIIDIISWLGLSLCIGAFFIKDILMLRVTTLLGCALMTIYYFSISVPQGTISNIIIGLVNIVYLYKMNKEETDEIDSTCI